MLIGVVLLSQRPSALVHVSSQKFYPKNSEALPPFTRSLGQLYSSGQWKPVGEKGRGLVWGETLRDPKIPPTKIPPTKIPPSENSTQRKFHPAKIPPSENSTQRKFHPAKIPPSEN